ncbi:MAG: hypothetical protein VSS75_029680 [Candidatus Parabeggiatoa sp.]|nr:hypothetical protein [Candidatus Parabeggiatoa sp.]
MIILINQRKSGVIKSDSCRVGRAERNPPIRSFSTTDQGIERIGESAISNYTHLVQRIRGLSGLVSRPFPITGQKKQSIAFQRSYQNTSQQIR